MTAPPSPSITSRKQPRQGRSTDLVAAILEAAAQVLSKEGASRFTTARVAEKAGVSIGSLYQYFPNKAAILFRLQSDEWRHTSTLLRQILADGAVPPLDRLRALVHAFVGSECEEAAMRAALGEVAPAYRRAPEAAMVRSHADDVLHGFLREVLPAVADRTRSEAAALIATTLNAVGKRFSEAPHTPAEITAFSDALADMVCAYLGSLSSR